MFVGIDVIGDYLTEINVTSPTGLVEIAAQTSLDGGAEIIKQVENILRKENEKPPVKVPVILLMNPVCFLAFVGGVGLLRKAPGTISSIIGLYCI